VLAEHVVLKEFSAQGAPVPDVHLLGVVAGELHLDTSPHSALNVHRWGNIWPRFRDGKYFLFSLGVAAAWRTVLGEFKELGHAPVQAAIAQANHMGKLVIIEAYLVDLLLHVGGELYVCHGRDNKAIYWPQSIMRILFRFGLGFSL
jgi:hypothetical protein